MTSYQLYHGNCLEVLPTLPANSVDAVICDPPYGSTACSWDTVIPFDDMWACIKHVLKPSGAVVLFGSEPFSSHLRLSNADWYKYDWYYQKTSAKNHLNARRQPLRNVETISVFYGSQCVYNPQMGQGKKSNISHAKGGVKNGCYGDYKPVDYKPTTSRYPTQVLKFKADTQKLSLHPTQKPIALMKYLVKTYTNKGQTVLDFAMGSGTTGAACGQTGRGFVGIELNDEYFNTASIRIPNAYGDFLRTDREKRSGQLGLFERMK